MGSSKFEINHRGDKFYSLTTLERQGDRLLVSSSIWTEGKLPLLLKANFALSFIQERFGIGLKQMNYGKDPKAYPIILFPISEDLEWKTVLLPEEQEGLFKFLDIKTHRK